MFTRQHTAKTTMSEVGASKEQIEAAKRFQENLRCAYETALQTIPDNEEIGAFYRSGQVMIRVSKIEMIPAIRALMLTAEDESGRPVVVAIYFKSIDITFRRVGLAEGATRSRVDFCSRVA